jgi:hypothetical protein
MKHYYVYFSYEEFGRGYIGSRTCYCDPKEDTGYLGSFRDESFKPTQKEILMVFESNEEALAAEIVLHTAYDVAKNPHFANKAKQTSTGFTTEGLTGENHPFFGKTHSEETLQKMSKSHLGRPVSEETRKKLAERVRGEGNPNYGKTGENHHSYGKPHTNETKTRISESKKGAKRWHNPGTGKESASRECPGEGWIPGISEQTKQKISETKRRKQ